MIRKTLLAAALLAASQAALAADLDISLTVADDYVAANKDVGLSLTLTNNSKHSLKVLKWYTAADGLEDDIFTVTRDGEEVEYLGRHYKRPAPSAKDYLVLKSGESLTQTLDLSAYYDMSEAGSYQVTYKVDAMDLLKSPGLAKTLVARADSLRSDAVSLWVDGVDFKGLSAKRPVVGDIGISSVSYQGSCSNSEKSSINSAVSAAQSIGSGALSYLQGQSSPSSSTRYKTWFGTYNSSRYSTVTSNFSKIVNALNSKPLVFDCSCNQSYFAYVYPNQPYTVYLCNAFWSAPTNGTDSKAGTIVHELSHFNVVAGTDDIVYGQSGAKSLALSNPSQAIQNADSHEYFAENTPALP